MLIHERAGEHFAAVGTLLFSMLALLRVRVEFQQCLWVSTEVARYSLFFLYAGQVLCDGGLGLVAKRPRVIKYLGGDSGLVEAGGALAAGLVD